MQDNSFEHTGGHLSLLRPPLKAGFDSREERAFAFFLHKAAPVLSGALDSSFWARLVPQLGQSEPIIWNAVLAIGCLYEHPRMSPYPIECVEVSHVMDSHHHQALKWYNKAIARFKIHIQQNPEDSSLALLSCLLFICIEFQQDNYSNALALLEQGFKLLSTTSPPETAYGNSHIYDVAAPFFGRLAVLASTFGTSDWYRRPNNPVFESNLAFATLRGARSVLSTLMEHGHGFVRRAGMRIVNREGTDDLIPLRDDLLSKLMDWRSMFSRLDCNPSSLEICALSNLLMHYDVVFIWLSTCLSARQSQFDQYTSHFESIVKHADVVLASNDTRPSFNFEMGVIPHLFFVATKCRHPIIRRRALSLIKKAPLQESLWQASTTATSVEKIIALEEETGGRFVEFPPARPVMFVDASTRIRHLEVLQELEPGSAPQLTIKKARYFDNLFDEQPLEGFLVSI